MSVNISTMAAIVAAGAGVPVVKHGNRSASSKAGRGRRARGPRGPARPAGRRRCSRGRGGGHHVLLRRRPSTRRCATPPCHGASSAIATTFNFLGPLANPAKPAAQAIGCADARMAPVMAGVFARRGVDAWVFRGDDGLDELTTTTTSRVWAVSGGEVSEFTVDPAGFGLGRWHRRGLRGGDAAYNAGVVRRLVAGETGPVRDAVRAQRRRRAGRARRRGRCADGPAVGWDRAGAGVARLRGCAGDPRPLGEGHSAPRPAWMTALLSAIVLAFGESCTSRDQLKPCSTTQRSTSWSWTTADVRLGRPGSAACRARLPSGPAPTWASRQVPDTGAVEATGDARPCVNSDVARSVRGPLLHSPTP